MKELAEQAEQGVGPELTLVEPPSGQRLTYLEFTRIRPFAGHPFRLYTGERLSDMVESIRKNGILTPLIVRRIFDDPHYDYEMLSGHNRMNAGLLAGLEGALCLVKGVMSHSEALMYVIETNLFQRSFRDLLPSEKAAVLVMRYSEMFSQGKRNDIIRELERLEGDDSADTCGNGFHRLSRDSLGQEYELTGRSIANYVRIGKYLSEELKLRLDSRGLSLRDALQLSHLKAEEQVLLDKVLGYKGCKLHKNSAVELRCYSREGRLDEKTMLRILVPVVRTGNGLRQKGRRDVKLTYQLYGKYFSPTASQKEIEKTITKALEFYFSAKESNIAV